MPDETSLFKPEVYPTREDIKSALEGLRRELDQRFCCEKKVHETRFEELDKRLGVEIGERDKAVVVLSEHLREQVRTGDSNLKQHIENQIEQIKAALASALKLQDVRFLDGHEKFDGLISALKEKLDIMNTTGLAQIEQRILGVQREVALVNEASEKAIQKADASNADKFKAANGWQEQFRNLLTTLMPRVEAEKANNANRESLFAFKDEVNRALNELKTIQSAVAGRGQGLNQGWGYIVAGVSLIAAFLVILTTLNAKVKDNTEFRRQAEPVFQQQQAPVR